MYIASELGVQSHDILEWQLPDAPPELMLEIIPAQLLTIPLAESRGFEPVHFPNATKVTTVE